MKIAIIGSGISGLTAAHLLYQHHQITVFEKADRLGGHTATKTVEHAGKPYAVDTGFIVFNDWTYPNFIALMNKIGVASQETSMGFSVSYNGGQYEYAGENLNTLFAQRRNFFNIHHWMMIRDILRFNKESVRDYKAGLLDSKETLGQYLARNRYSQAFKNYYLLPMGAAIWSSSLGDMLDFPLLFFVRFFDNHGLLSVNNRPTWRVIQGGSSAYLQPLIAPFSQNIHLSARIEGVERHAGGVRMLVNGVYQEFDEVIFACHSDEALALLRDKTEQEDKVLGAITYRQNSVVLHTDEALLPRRKLTWSSWNYLLDSHTQKPPVLTYSMNILQGINAPVEFCVTLNARERINPAKILGDFSYAHPVFTPEAIAAQQQWSTINGVNKTWFCGAYWFNGFHEDGVKSALRIAEHLGGDAL